MLAFLKRLFCRHRTGRLISIGFDGESVYKCDRCGKYVRRSL